MATRYTVHIVPHTHWDRAWYLPFEEFRFRLVRLIDKVAAMLEADPAFTTFCLDGQTIVLEDYLKIRPGMADRLKALVAAKRLRVGPWYILPDEYLVSGESMIRNLQIGMADAEAFGGTMRAGYVPDTFGHIAQLPQILRGFGLDTFIFARGLYEPDNDLKLEFRWEALDGTGVLALHQRFHYNNAVFLGYRIGWGDTEGLVKEPAQAMKRIAEACAALEPFARSHHLLLNNGVDHSEPQADLPDLLAEARSEMPQYDFRISSFEEYANDAKRELADTPLQRKRGELYFDYGDILHGVYSSRMYLKQQNRYCQDLLERYAEPLAAIAAEAGAAAYPADMLRHAWRTLLKNHPHDDICGCSVDRVHDDMDYRFAQVRIAGENLVREAFRALARSMDHRAQPGVPLVVFNPVAAPRRETAELDVDLSIHDEPWDSFRIVGEDGAEIPYEPIRSDELFWMEPVKGFQVRRHRIRLELETPALGYRTLYVQEGRRAKPKAAMKVRNDGCDTADYSLRIADDGSLSLTDKASKRRFAGLLLFEDMEDCGDVYNWSYLEKHSRRITTAGRKAQVALSHRDALSATWTIAHRLRIPVSLTADRSRRSRRTVAMTIASEVTCRAGSPRIDVTTRVTNTAKDHRLRALFPAGIETGTVDVDGHFAFLERSVEMPPARDLPPYPTQHQGRFASLRDGQGGFAVINDGLPEFEALREESACGIALTLFRSVGWLSRNDYPTRRVHAGPPLETPGAQCLRPMEFRYAFMAYDGAPERAAAEALRHNLPCIATRGDIRGGTDVRSLGIPYDEFVMAQPSVPVAREGRTPPTASMVSLGTDRVQLSAVKRCGARGTLILRIYNPGGETAEGVLRLWRPVAEAWRTNLAEEREEAAAVAEGAIPFACRAYGIETYEVRLR